MKKTLLALAVVSAASMASAQVELSGEIKGNLSSNNGSRALFNSYGDFSISAEEDLGNGITAYAEAAFEFDSNFIAGDGTVIGVKGGFGDVQIGDVGSACDDLQVGGSHEQELDTHAVADCADGFGGANGIKYTGEFDPVTFAASYNPDAVPGEDEMSVGVKGDIGPVAASLGYVEYISSGANALAVGLEGEFSGFTLGTQFTQLDAGVLNVDAYEINAKYDLPTGSVYAGWGQDYFDNDAWSAGYTHNISSRTFGWVEIGEADFHNDTSYNLGLGHNF